MKQIQLETVDDAVSVFNNWHQDILMIIQDMVECTVEHEETDEVINAVYALLHASPFKSNHFINTQTMYENTEIIESIIND